VGHRAPRRRQRAAQPHAADHDLPADPVVLDERLVRAVDDQVRPVAQRLDPEPVQRRRRDQVDRGPKQ
jgi:hypothetical protein